MVYKFNDSWIKYALFGVYPLIYPFYTIMRRMECQVMIIRTKKHFQCSLLDIEIHFIAFALLCMKKVSKDFTEDSCSLQSINFFGGIYIILHFFQIIMRSLADQLNMKLRYLILFNNYESEIFFLSLLLLLN